MLEKLKTALVKRGEHQSALDELEKGLEDDHSSDLALWRSQAVIWDKEHRPDPTVVNPYVRKGESKCYNDASLGQISQISPGLLTSDHLRWSQVDSGPARSARSSARIGNRAP